MARALTTQRRSQRYALDASVLVSIVDSGDEEHYSCYSFFRNLDDDHKALWVVPGLIFFEFQAAQSKKARKKLGQTAFRRSPLNYENTELYHVTKKFLIKVHDLNLYNQFSHLHGADLLYACIARVEGIPLVTHDKHFDRYENELTLIRPRDLMRRTGTVTLESGGKLYKVGYEAINDGAGGIVRLDTGQATHIGAGSAKLIAGQLLREIVVSGLADRMGLGTPKR